MRQCAVWDRLEGDKAKQFVLFQTVVLRYLHAWSSEYLPAVRSARMCKVDVQSSGPARIVDVNWRDRPCHKFKHGI